MPSSCNRLLSLHPGRPPHLCYGQTNSSTTGDYDDFWWCLARLWWHTGWSDYTNTIDPGRPNHLCHVTNPFTAFTAPNNPSALPRATGFAWLGNSRYDDRDDINFPLHQLILSASRCGKTTPTFCTLVPTSTYQLTTLPGSIPLTKHLLTCSPAYLPTFPLTSLYTFYNTIIYLNTISPDSSTSWSGAFIWSLCLSSTSVSSGALSTDTVTTSKSLMLLMTEHFKA